MPKYKKSRGGAASRRFSHYAPLVTSSIGQGGGSNSGKEEGSSDDEGGLRGWRGRPRGSVSSAGPILGPTTIGGGTLIRAGSEAMTDEDDTLSNPSAK
jgi:hypothetical protein